MDSILIATLVISVLIGLATYGLMLLIQARTERLERFLSHLEIRITQLQKAEFDRQVVAEQDRWRKNFGEEPPKSIADDVRMHFDVFPPFDECEKRVEAIFRRHKG